MSNDASTLAAVSSDVVRWSVDGGGSNKPDLVAREEPLEIRVQGRCVAVTMRTPGHDTEVAAGFLLSEGLIRTRADVVEIAPCRYGEASNHENVLNVFVAPHVPVDLEKLTRHVFASSSCGMCGKASIESVHQHFAPVTSAVRIKAEVLLELPDRLRAWQRTFDETGGLHAAAVFTNEGELVVMREDVGRHNAVDKVLGFGLLEGRLPWEAHVLLVSGRTSFEIMQKALAGRIPIVAAISAPSSLAVEFARESGQTLVGFLRGKSMNVYSEEQRIEWS
jgi:FdhD protein